MHLRLVLFAAALGLGAALSGCEPSCRTTCKKLLACDDVETPRVAESDCEYSCEAQQKMYEDDWGDLQKRDAFGQTKQCVMDNTCADIADGVCYDEDLYIW